MKGIALFFLLATPAFGAQPEGLYLAPDRAAALQAAVAIINNDPFANLVTLDTSGQPRIRTMEHSPADANMVIYLATIPGTRKLAQIRAHPKVTLLFDNPNETAYVSIMGTASIHTDPATVQQHAWQSPEALKPFWPNFPRDYVLIRVEPQWLEVISPSIMARDSDWRPQAILFE